MGADLLAAGASTETLAALPVESNVVRRAAPATPLIREITGSKTTLGTFGASVLTIIFR